MAEQNELFNFDFEPIKGYPELRWAGKRPFTGTPYYPAQLKETHGSPSDDGWMNKLYWGDNLQVMSHLLKDYRGKVDLIYIDPPFDSKADYKKKISLRGKTAESDSSNFEEKQYGDIWTNDEYLQFMFERLVLCRELLSEKGSIYLHCDWHRSHYLRMILDEVFGARNMLNELIRKYSVGGKGDGFFARKHDTIFFYAKNIDKVYFNADDVRVEFTPHKQDKSGKNYGGRMGIDENGRPYVEKWGTGNKKLYRYYLDVGKIPEDVWEFEKDEETIENINSVLLELRKKLGAGLLYEDVFDSQTIQSAAKERTEYPTQKPETLLERIILASSPKNGLVFDCFMGSGTTQAVAMKLGRRFLGADINLGAIQTTTKRLINRAKELESELTDETKYTGFEVYNVNDYDFFRNELEAKRLIIEALGMQPLPENNLWDAELDGRMVSILGINRIATASEFEKIIANIDIADWQKKQSENPGKPVEAITFVCMGHDPNLKAMFDQKMASLGFKVDLQIVDILRDKKDLTFKRDSDAKIKIKKGQLVVEQFYPMNLLQKLSIAKKDISDWKELVDSIMIDWNYDGVTFSPVTTDIPEKNEMVKGTYKVPQGAGTIHIKITDLISESWEGNVQ